MVREPAKNGIVRKRSAWLRSHPSLAERVLGTEPDRHVQLKGGLAAAQYPVEWVEAFLKVIREDVRGSEELSTWLLLQLDFRRMRTTLQMASLMTACGGVLGTQKSETGTARAHQVGSQHRRLGARFSEGHGSRGSPTPVKISIGRGEIKKAMTKSDAPSAAELFRRKAKGKRTLAMCDISRAHFHGVPLRRLFIDREEEEGGDGAERLWIGATASAVVTLVVRRQKSESSECRGHHSVQGSHDAHQLLIFVFCCRKLGAWNEGAYDEAVRGASVCWVLLSRVFERRLCQKFCTVSAVQTTQEISGHASPDLEWESCGVTLDQAWKLGAQHHNTHERRVSEYYALRRA